SPLFIAVFMSSVSRAFRDMGGCSRGLRVRAGGWSRRGEKETQKPASLAQCRPMNSLILNAGAMPAFQRNSVQALALGHVAGDATQMTLHRGGALALALLRRLFVELALAHFGQDAGLLAGALPAAQGQLERLAVANFDAGHSRPRISSARAVGRAVYSIPMTEDFAKARRSGPVLGVETSCDETGVAVFDPDRGLLAHTLYSQIRMHADYGGVVPELASRDHVRKLDRKSVV